MTIAARSLAAVALLALSAACSAETVEDDASASEDAIVATFDQQGKIDLQKTSRILLVGDSDKLGELPLFAATTKARRLAQLYPNDQIVLFITQDVTAAEVPRVGGTVVKSEPFGTVALSDLRRLSAGKLVGALDRFKRIASLEFFGHSSPFGALTEASGDGRVLAGDSLGVLADNFARDANPYVTLNGCNGGVNLAPELSRLWKLPVSGALTGSNFQVLMSDNRWYPNDDGAFPAELTRKTKNDKSYAGGATPSCSAGACVRMKPQDSPYRGVWADPETGFQYGLGYYKFFCNYADPDKTCAKGMAASLYSFPSVKPIDARSSERDVRDVLADFLCNGSKDGAWFDQCKTKLEAAVASGEAFSPMKSANDFSHECDFAGCEQKFRCKVVDGVPQKKSCVWVSKTCGAGQSAASCRPANTTKQTTNHEYARYLEGHRLLSGR